MSQLESASADIISSILRQKQLPEHNTVGHMILLTFVVFLSARTQYTAEALNEMIDKQIKTIFREDPRVKDHLDKVEIKYENPAAFSLVVTAELVAEYSPVIQTSGKNEKLIHMYNEDVRNKLKLSFVSETRRAKRYKLGNKAVHLRNPKLLVQ